MALYVRNTWHHIAEISNLPDTDIRISYHTQSERLHAKAYIFERNSGFDTAYIGSSNLSRSALTRGLEWNLRVTNQENPHIIQKTKGTFEHYWNSNEFEDFREGGMEKFRRSLKAERERDKVRTMSPMVHMQPHFYQKEILDKLRAERDIHNRHKNLVVAATGTGKTVVAAFDFKRYYDAASGKYRLLFIAHRKEILEQARHTFRSVLNDRNFGQLWVDQYRPDEGNLEHLFISVQSFHNNKNLLRERTPSDYFDFIIIDEAHHAPAGSYRQLFAHYNPGILLGLTATPERMDGRSLLPDFDHTIAAEIRLPDALSLKLLSPFQYFCISDETVDLSKAKWTSGRYDTEDLTRRLSSKKRAVLVVDAISHYLTDPHTCKALCFCASKEHAQYMSEAMNERGLRATFIVSGSTAGSREERENIREQLREGKINYVCAVDIFNEGVDIPEIDTVLFLRPTESLTVFMQQLGRGLRIATDKECLTVLDFVSQAHASYNFGERFRALLGKSDRNIKKEIEKGFPGLPPGCTLKMERQARHYILDNINRAIFNKRRIIKELLQFSHQTDQPLTLQNFLIFHNLDIRTIYSSRNSTHNHWSALKREAGLLQHEPSEHYDTIARGLRRLVHIDSPAYLSHIRNLLDHNFRINTPDTSIDQFTLMFYYDIWQRGIREQGFDSVSDALSLLGEEPILMDEIREIVDVCQSRIDHTTCRDDLGIGNVLELHARYTRDEILAAFGKSTPERHFPSQEGVVKLQEHNAELLFVTLHKSDKDFSPTTQYDDYAISETLFHWQSQNRVSPESREGLSYIHHQKHKKMLLLFVRKHKKDGYGFTEPYFFLGPVSYLEHHGARPMSIKWELSEPMPPKLWKEAGKMAVG